MKQVIFTVLALFEPDAGASQIAGDGIQTALLIVGALGLRELLPVLVKHFTERRKSMAAVAAIETRSKLDEKEFDAEEYQKGFKRFIETIDQVVVVTKELDRYRNELREANNEKVECQRREIEWLTEKTHLEAATTNAGREIHEKNQIIVELRGEIQKMQEKLEKNGYKH